jgi:isovaleryl-CoA dehydrogenase
MATRLDSLARVVDETVRPDAIRVDSEGTFPRSSIDALADSGLLGLTVAMCCGGGGGSLRDAVEVVRALAGACGSPAMVTLMDYAATAVIEAHGPQETREAIGAGRHLTTLAFSERGSRSQLWSPVGTATASGEQVRLDAEKSWITAAAHADSYVWSSRPLSAEGAMTLWLVPSGTIGLSEPGPFDGLGLRGNHSAPVRADGAIVSADAMLGPDGAGLDVAMGVALPWFLVVSAAFCAGVMEAVTAETGIHLRAARFEHLGQALIESPVLRMDHARMHIVTDQVVALLLDALSALDGGRADAQLRVLEVKPAAGEAVLSVTDLAMKVCDGAAFRKEMGIERMFRDERAIRAMAPTSDALLDFVGRTINGLPLL